MRPPRCRSSSILLNMILHRYSTVSTLLQYYLLIPLPQKDVHLIYLANTLAQNSIIIFTRTVHDAQRLAFRNRS